MGVSFFFILSLSSSIFLISPEHPLPGLRPGVEVHPDAVTFDIGEVRPGDLAFADPVEVNLPGVALADAALLRDADLSPVFTSSDAMVNFTLDTVIMGAIFYL